MRASFLWIDSQARTGDKIPGYNVDRQWFDKINKDKGDNGMAYDEGLAQRIRETLDEPPGLVEKKMFGGVGFMLHGNMACGVHKNKLIVRVGPGGYEEAMRRPHTAPFDITGRAMKGWVMVEATGYESDDDLKEWVQMGVDFALTLPPK